MSLLNDLAQDTLKPIPKSKVSTAFGNAFNHFLSRQDAKPQLVVLGDLLDLQFSDRTHATQTAKHFLKGLTAEGRLHKTLIATAGNHDHALWTDARLSLESHQLVHPDKYDDTSLYRSATKAFEPDDMADSRLLSKLATGSGFEKVDFRYPNIGFGDENRAVFLHHGHFIESPYRLISHLKDFLTKNHRSHLSHEEIASENAMWIDFFWATLGETSLSEEAYDIYQQLLTSAGFRTKSAEWSVQIAEKLSELLPLSGNITVQDLLRRLVQVGFDATLGAFSDTERSAVVEKLTLDGWDGLQWYLDGVVKTQIDQELRPNDSDPKELTRVKDLTFIFGHTHKPFADRIQSAASPNPVRVFNTGGWTQNGVRLDDRHGASMALIDDALNVVSMKLFGTPQHGEASQPVIEILSEPNEGAITFAQNVQDWYEASRKSWAELTKAAEAAYLLRQKLLLDRTNPQKPKKAIAS